MSGKRIKVLHLIKSLGRGGAEKLIPETALVHDQSRFEFHCLYFYHQDQNIVEELLHAGIQVHLIPSSNFGLFFQVNKVREFVKLHQFDLIHAHLPWAGILARFVGTKLSIPIVYTEHNTWDRYNKVSYWGNRVSFKQQDVAVAVSNEVALSMRLNSFWDPYQRGGRLKIKVVQNGVNTEVFRKVSSIKYQVLSRDASTWFDSAHQPSLSRSVGGLEVGSGKLEVWETEDGGLKDEGRSLKDEKNVGRLGDRRRETEDGSGKDEGRSLKDEKNVGRLGDRRRKTEDGGLKDEGRSLKDEKNVGRLGDRKRETDASTPLSTGDGRRKWEDGGGKGELGIPEGSPVIGKVAVFRSQKRLWLWVELALRILEKRPDVHFLLVGDGDWRERIEKQILQSGKATHFHLVGVQKAVNPFLSRMDIYLSTSEFEGLPIAMLEAMSCEVPVIATRAGGIGEVIQHGIQGFLTEIEHWEELEGYCLKLLDDSQLQKKMAKAARQRVIDKFSMIRMVRELEAIYEQVCKG